MNKMISKESKVYLINQNSIWILIKIILNKPKLYWINQNYIEVKIIQNKSGQIIFHPTEST